MLKSRYHYHHYSTQVPISRQGTQDKMGSMLEKNEKDAASLEHQMTIAGDSNIGDVTLSQTDQLERGLKSRHIQFLALGGACVTPFPPLGRQRLHSK